MATTKTLRRTPSTPNPPPGAPRSPLRSALVAALAAACLATPAAAGQAPPDDAFVPVTDAMLQDPAPGDWLTWRRTLDGWGYSPLDQIDRGNVGDLRMVWSRALAPGRQEGTPLAYRGVLYMPQASDVIEAIDAETGDLLWQHRRDLPDDVYDFVGGNARNNRNIAIYDRFIINTSDDNYAFALDAETGEIAWETRIFDYRETPAGHSSGPIIADGRVVSGRSCRPRGGPETCVVVAHDALTGEELWRRRTVPAPGEPGDETWGGVPYEQRIHVGTWMPASYDPELRLIYQGTSVTSPAPKFMLGGIENTHLYHNSTLALDVETGEIRWYYQHMNDHWDLDHPFERILVDTAVAPDPDAVSWINPRIRPGEVRKVMTGIPGKTGVVYTLDRETGEFLWATPTVAQNVIDHIDGATGAVTENAEVIFTAEGQTVLACPNMHGGKDWEAGAYSPLTNTLYMPMRNMCQRLLATTSPTPRTASTRWRCATSTRPAATSSAPCTRSRPRPARPAGCTSSGPRRSPWWRPAAGSCSAATRTAGSAPSIRRPARCCGRSTSARRSAASPSASRWTAASTWR